MKKIQVKLQDRSYDITIGAGALRTIPAIIKNLSFTGPVVLFTDKTVQSKTKKVLSPILKAIKNDIVTVTVPAGEASKSIDVFTDVVKKISQKTKGHVPLILAVGGGVIGDLAGFVASTYRRGVPFIQVPTTLLAQVDSSVGGKVGIDLPAAKNLVGAFYQPKAVVVDTDFLKTLPKRQLRNGIGEVIKYGVIKKRSFFEYLEKNMDRLCNLNAGVLEKVVYESLYIKSRMVEKDERDVKDIRITLNFGHTLGHAIETASGYSKAYNHGESIAIGMLLASEIAIALDMFKEKDLIRIKDLMKRAGLPLCVKGVALAEVMESQKYDKKFVAGSNRFVLPKRIGAVEVVEDIPSILIRTVLKKYVRK